MYAIGTTATTHCGRSLASTGGLITATTGATDGGLITATTGATDGGLNSAFSKSGPVISGWAPPRRWSPAPPGKSSAGDKPPARSQPALLARREADLRQELRARMTKKRRVYRHRSGQSRDATNRLRSSFRLRMAERIV